MRFALSFLILTLLVQVSYAQTPVYKVSYTFSVSEEMEQMLAENEESQEAEGMEAMRSMLENAKQGKSAIDVWVNPEYFKVVTPQAPQFYQVINKKERSLLWVNQSDSTYTKQEDVPLYFVGEAASGDPETDWVVELVPGKTEMIAGFPCKLARVRFAAETLDEALAEETPSFEVWYTEKIPAYIFGAFDFLTEVPGAALKVNVNGLDFFAKAIKQEDVAADFFDVPAGFQNEDLLVEDVVPSDMELGDGMIAYFDSTTNQYGLKTVDETIVTKPIYTQLSEVRDGIIVASNTDYKNGFIDLKGNIILPFEYESVQYDETLGAYIYSKEGKFSVMDKSGKPLWDKTFDSLDGFDGQLAIFTQDEKSGLVDQKGHIVVPANYEVITQFDEHYFVTIENEKSKVYDLKTQKMLLDGFPELFLSNVENLFIASNDGVHYGFVDQKGVTKIPFIYSYVSQFVDGLATVARVGEDEFIQINLKGETVSSTSEN